MSENASPVAPVQNIVHTPGPWYASTFLVSTKPGHYDYGRLSIVQTGCHDIREPDECIANARLIAAAPELLEACQLVSKWMLGGMPKPYSDSLVLELVGKAISKATKSVM